MIIHSKKLRSFIFCISVFMFINLSASAQSKMNIDEGWKFHFGHAADPAKDFNYGISAIFSKSGKTDQTALAANFDDKDWRTLNLPHDWAVELPFSNSPNFDVQSHGYKPVGGLYPETSIGWYRKHISLAKADSGSRISLQFDGIQPSE
jgi:beta-galactosidase